MDYELIFKVDEHDEQDASLEFAANARTDVPRLIATIRERDKRIAELEERR